MKAALITGITGQDGAYLAQFLLAKNYKIYGCINSAVPYGLNNLNFLEIERSVEFIFTNLLDVAAVTRLLEKVEPNEIYHLAAQSSVGLSFQEPAATIEFNVLSTINLLEAIRNMESQTRFFHPSSGDMYGKVQNLPVTEQTCPRPVSPYGISKACAHWLTINYRQAHNLFACCGIMFNHESVLRARHFVTKKIVSTALRISKGSNETLKLGNIEIRRDWGYAPEYVEAMWLMLQQESPDDFMIATGEAHSIAEFVAEAFGYFRLDWREHTEVDKVLYRPSDIDVLYGDPSKARTKLGWKHRTGFRGLVKLLVEEEMKYSDKLVA